MLPVHNLEGYNLKKYSVNPAAEAKALNRLPVEQKAGALKKNLDAYVNHVLEDNVVSLPYAYRLGINNRVLVYPSDQEVFLDERERGGLYKVGLTQAFDNCVNHPHMISLLYSSPGMTSFDNDPDNPYTQVGKYKDGQLYVMYFDGVKINNAAVSIGKPGESWVKQILGDVYREAEQKSSDKEKISHLISHPYLTGLDIDQFLAINGRVENGVVYKNNKNHEFTLWETLDLLRKSFSGNLALSIKNQMPENFFDNKHLNDRFILNSYKHLIVHYMVNNGLRSLKLSGSCGSEEKFKISDLIDSVENFVNNFSSLDRLLKQKLPKDLGDKDEDKNHDFYPCPHCSKPIPYEKNVKDKSSWLTNCPHCGFSIKNVC